MAFDLAKFISGIGGMIGAQFGDSGKPYDAAMEQYDKYGQLGQATQQPYLNAGTGAIGDYQDWLKNQQNPAQFINSLSSQYQSSPYAQYLQGQAQLAGQNAASASGLMGSTPMMQQLQQNAANISFQDQNQWLQNVLGINTQYGQGQNNLMQGGQNAANSLTNMYNQQGQNMANMAYGKEAGNQQDMWDTIGGGIRAIGGVFGF